MINMDTEELEIVLKEKKSVVAGMAVDQSTPHSFLYTSSLIKLASYSSSTPSHISCIERHISQRLLFTTPPPGHRCPTSFTDIY